LWLLRFVKLDQVLAPRDSRVLMPGPNGVIPLTPIYTTDKPEQILTTREKKEELQEAAKIVENKHGQFGLDF
jgi:hypothetical protein